MAPASTNGFQLLINLLVHFVSHLFDRESNIFDGDHYAGRWMYYQLKSVLLNTTVHLSEQAVVEIYEIS